MTLAEDLEGAVPPDARGAEARAWAELRDARPAPGSRDLPRGRRWPAVAVAALAAAGLAAAAGRPGEAVGDWVRRVVAPERPAARPAAFLPGGGTLLAVGRDGAVLVRADGRARRLGPFTAATWSPHGRFVAGIRGPTLTAVDPRGRVRWRLRAPRAIAAAAWSPDGFRIAYSVRGAGVRVVAGDGTGDHPYGPRATSAAIAWRPGEPHTLASVDRHGRVDVRDSDTARLRSRTATGVGRGARGMAWSPDGRRLAVARAEQLVLLDLHRNRIARIDLEGWRAASLAWAPGRRVLALALRSRDGRRSRIALLSGAALRRSGNHTLGASGDRLAWPVGLAGVTWSPDGRRLLADWPGPRQWMLVRAGGPPRVELRAAPRALGAAPGAVAWRG